MRQIIIITAVLLVCYACKKPLQVQEKSINGFALRVQYMPSKDTGMLCLRLHVRNSDGAPLKNTDDIRFNYGLDSLFALVHLTDTLHPVDVFRVANGNVNGLEYMLLFDRPHAYRPTQLVFRDWLFTSQLMTFFIDSLSTQI